MNNKSPSPIDMDQEVNPNAVSLYGQGDAMDDFPVLKAFQQYIDSEQAKSRKRLISLGIFFCVLMGAVIAVFLVLLFNINERNQTLNDRLVEFAMKERHQGPVVVQPPVQQDNTALLSLTSKLEEMQKKLNESEKKAEAAERAQKEAAAAVASALAPKAPSPQEIEIARLKAQLEAQKEAVAAEKAKQREAELEAYRRKHYPECYAPKKSVVRPASVAVDESEDDDLSEEVPVRRVNRRKTNPESVLKGKAVKYFDEEEDDEPEVKASTKPELVAPQAAPPSQPAKTANPQPYVIPVEVKGKQSSWRLP